METVAFETFAAGKIAMNYWAVLVAGLAYFVLGAIWYAGPVFGNAWMAGIGKTREQVLADYSPTKLVWAFFGSMIASYGIARVMIWSGGNSLQDGLMVGSVAAVCFVGVAMGVNDNMESRPCKLTVINILYHIVGFLIMGAVIGLWR